MITIKKGKFVHRSNGRIVERMKYIKLMRMKHYIKNVLIFVPLFFSQNIFDMDKITASIIGCISFCLISSSIYIINDLNDVEKDRLHPTKCKRPIASGAVTKQMATLIAAICIIAGIGLNIGCGNTRSIFWIGLYFILNILYSWQLKNVPIIDVVILTSGFLIRVLYGAALTDIVISNWLYLTVIAGAFYMGLGKRRNELKKQKENEVTREVLTYYTYDFLDKNMYVCLALTNTFYALWAMGHENEKMIWTVPLIIIIMMKYSLDIEGESDGDPVEVLVKDKMLIILCAICVIAMVALLYWV